MKLIKENFKSLWANGALLKREDGTEVFVSPYITDERWAKIKAELEPKLNAKLPLFLEKFGTKK